MRLSDTVNASPAQEWRKLRAVLVKKQLPFCMIEPNAVSPDARVCSRDRSYAADVVIVLVNEVVSHVCNSIQFNFLFSDKHKIIVKVIISDRCLRGRTHQKPKG